MVRTPVTHPERHRPSPRGGPGGRVAVSPDEVVRSIGTGRHRVSTVCQRLASAFVGGSEWTCRPPSPHRPWAGALLDIDGLAARLGVTARFVRRSVEERRVPYLKIGRLVRFDPAERSGGSTGARVRTATVSPIAGQPSGTRFHDCGTATARCSSLRALTPGRSWSGWNIAPSPSPSIPPATCCPSSTPLDDAMDAMYRQQSLGATWSPSVWHMSRARTAVSGHRVRRSRSFSSVVNVFT